MSHVYFSKATFNFLRALARNNNRPWFHAHQSRYEREVREPFLQLIADLQAPLARISPHMRADPRKVGGSLFRIQRDTRYAHDKTPYKPWAGARLFHERRREVAAPSFYLHIAPGECFVGGGIWHPEAPTLARIRDFIVDNPAAWKRASRGIALRSGFSFRGESLSRAPRGHAPDHELIDDLKRKSYALAMPLSDALACSAELLPTTITACKRVAPLIDYLCAALDLEF